MYINFEEISPTLLNTFSESFNLDSKNTTVLYKITNITENKFDDFEKSIFPYLFIDNIYYILYDDNIYKLISKTETSTKISTENIISSIKLKISKDDKIMSLYDSYKEKTLKYAYIHGSLII